MCALNPCLDTKLVGTARFSTLVGCLRSLKREHNKLLLSMKNLHELGSNPFPYIAPVIPHSLLGEVIKGEHFILTDFLK